MSIRSIFITGGIDLDMGIDKEYREYVAKGVAQAAKSQLIGRAQLRTRYERLIALVDNACRYYRSIGRAVIIKEAGSELWVGTLQGGGSIAVAAAAVDEDWICSARLGTRICKLLDRQIRLGGRAYVAADMQGRYFMLPWSLFDGHDEFGRGFVYADEAAKYEVLHTGVMLSLFDFKDGRAIDGAK